MATREEKMMKPHKVVYVKVTNRCNLQCAMCYNSICNMNENMDDNVLNASLSYIRELVEDNDVDVILHGGEPTLYDLNKLCNFVVHCITCGASVTMTTNLAYRITEEHMKLFRLLKDYNNSTLILQTSWDPVSIRFRDDRLETKWTSNVRYIQENIPRVEVQPIICVTKQLIEEWEPLSLLAYMSGVPVRRLNFSRLSVTGRAQDNEKDIVPSNDEVDIWLEKLYHANRDNYTMDIPIFNELDMSVGYGCLVGCRARKCSEFVRTINPDGSIATCPNIPLDTIGSVLDETKENPDLIKDLQRRENIKFTTCYSCENYEVCNGDCSQLRWDESGCVGLKRVIKAIKEEY